MNCTSSHENTCDTVRSEDNVLRKKPVNIFSMPIHTSVPDSDVPTVRAPPGSNLVMSAAVACKHINSPMVKRANKV